MECLLAAVVLLAGGLALVAALTTRVSGGYWNSAFEHAARRFHGVLQRGGLIHAPCLWLQHGSAQASLTAVAVPRGGGERYVQMAIQQREIQTRCEIYYYQTRQSLLTLRRDLSPIEFDWEDFRRRWMVLADDGEAARQLLSDGVRHSIEMLWRQPCPAEMTISISPGWFIIRKVWQSPRGVDLESFIELSCLLADQLNLAVVSGIDFAAGDEPKLIDEGRCGVCGENLAGDILVCSRCQTPHHRECWQYGGGCVTYGCGSRECSVPSVAPLGDAAVNDPLLAEALAERRAKPR